MIKDKEKKKRENVSFSNVGYKLVARSSPQGSYWWIGHGDGYLFTNKYTHVINVQKSKYIYMLFYIRVYIKHGWE